MWLERALPKVPGESQHVLLVHQRQLTARPSRGGGEGIADTPLHPESGVYRTLGGHLRWSPTPEESAFAHISALTVLPDDHEVATPSHEGSHADVQIKLSAQTQDDAALHDAGRHLRVPDRRTNWAFEDCIASTQLRHVFVTQDVAVASVAVGAEVEADLVEVDTGSTHDVYRHADSFRPNPVTRDDGDAVGHWVVIRSVRRMSAPTSECGLKLVTIFLSCPGEPVELPGLLELWGKRLSDLSARVGAPMTALLSLREACSRIRNRRRYSARVAVSIPSSSKRVM